MTDFREKLAATAKAFIASTDLDPSTGQLDTDLALKYRTADCKQTWGHTYFKTKVRPGLDGVFNNEQFLKHTSTMVPKLYSVTTKVTDLIIDERALRVMARASFYMTPRASNGGAASETVENDIVWLLTMNESGEKVKEATEFIDSAAAAKLGELISRA